MGIAAYNRGSRLISREIDRLAPSAVAIFTADLNNLPRDPDAGAPFETPEGMRLVRGHGGWWLECCRTGFGYWATTPWKLFRHWLVDIVGDDPKGGFHCRAWTQDRVSQFRTMTKGAA
jgi:hypothetical protein